MSNCFWTTLVGVNTNCSFQSGWVFNGSLFYELPEYELEPPPEAPPGSPTLTSEFPPLFSPPSVVKTDDGRTHAVIPTHQAAGDINNILPTYMAYYYSDDDGRTWTAGNGAVMDDPPMYFSRLYDAQDVEGIALVTDGDDVYLIQSGSELGMSPGVFAGESLITWKLTGGSWVKSVVDSVDMSIVNAAMAPNGDIYVLGWDVYWGTDRAHVAVSSDEGATWTTYALDSGWEITGLPFSTSMVFDGSGNLHIIMAATDGTTQSVLYYRPTGATAWASAFEMLEGLSDTGSGNENLAAQLLIDSEGDLYALYMVDYPMSDRGAGIYYAKSTDNGSTWEFAGVDRPMNGQIISTRPSGNADDMYGLDGYSGFHAAMTDDDDIHVIVELGIGSERGVYWLISTDGETYSDPFPMQYITGTEETPDDPGYESYSEALGAYHGDHEVGGYYGLPETVELSGGIIHVLFNRVPDFDITYNTNIGTVLVADEPPVVNYIKYVIP